MDNGNHRALDPSAAIAIEAVSYTFGSGSARKPVLFDLSLHLAGGEFVVVTGPSGAGKTTLLTLVGALRALQTGSIKVLGTELAGLDARGQLEIRRKTGFIFQDHNLFDALTSYQTLRLAMELGGRAVPKREALQRATDMLGELGMAQHLHARPRELSTGEKQRVAIARALVNNPSIILADEPTASLDRQSTDAVIGVLKNQARRSGAPIVMVTHDNRLFAMANRIITMADGRITAPS